MTAPAPDALLGDHVRGCEGRQYTCTCGYDDQQDARIATLTAERDSAERISQGRYETGNKQQIALLDALDRAEAAESQLAAAKVDAERYRFWRRFYDCRFALSLRSISFALKDEGYAPSVALSFIPSRPKVEIAKDYEALVDAAIDAAIEAGKK